MVSGDFCRTELSLPRRSSRRAKSAAGAARRTAEADSAERWARAEKRAEELEGEAAKQGAGCRRARDLAPRRRPSRSAPVVPARGATMSRRHTKSKPAKHYTTAEKLHMRHVKRKMGRVP